MIADRKFGLNTLALHAGQRPDPTTGARAMPIYQTTSYVFEDSDQAAELFALQRFGNIYTRIMNPTVAAFEERVAALEGGVGALGVASGHSAQFVTMFTLLGEGAADGSGNHIVSSKSLYGGTRTQFDITLRKMGIQTTFVDIHNLDEVKAAFTDKTRALYAETIGNPVIDVPNIEGLAKLAHDFGVPLVMDNTFATPYLCRPFEWGADIVIHSATKFIGGHGTSMGGIIVDSGKFPWDNGLFPGMTEPSQGYHGIRFFETFGDFGWIMKARVETLRDVGPALSPFNAFMMLQGLETLGPRMERHVANGKLIAEWLAQHECVEWVNYPALPDNPYNKNAQKYLPKGPGSIFTFGIKGGVGAGKSFIEALQLFSHVANVGDARSLVIHPASTTHSQMTEDEQISAGVRPEMIRLSIGLEDTDDLMWDLDNALRHATKNPAKIKALNLSHDAHANPLVCEVPLVKNKN